MNTVPFSTLSVQQQEVAYRRAADRLYSLRSNLGPQYEALVLELERRRVLSSLASFVEHFWNIVEPKAPLQWNWHLDALCEIVHTSLDEQQNEIINVPPGTMKSLLMSVFARAYLWAKDPSLRFLIASYGAHLSVRDNVKLRTIVTCEEYKRLFPHVVLTEDENQKVKYSTTAGGWSIASSVGGVGTGEHPDYVVIDDPLTAQQAQSAAERESVISWLEGTVSTRGVSRGVRVWLIMQRLHEDDLTGYLLRKGGWRHTCFPMRLEIDRKDPRDARKTAGELLWPTLFDSNMVRSLELKLGPYGVAGQLQQRPAPEGGGLFQRSWFPIVDKAPTSVRRKVRGWDVAGTPGGGDWTAGVRISEGYDGRFYVEDAVRGQWGPADVDATIARTAQLDTRSCAIREEREGGSAGKAVVFGRARLLLGFDYSGIPASGSKVTRAGALRSQCEAGNVVLVRGPWNEAYIQELCAFPTSGHDDQVDASSCAFNELIILPYAMPAAPTSVGEGSSYWNSGGHL